MFNHMKKIIYKSLFFCLLLLTNFYSSLIQGQEIVFQEDFESGWGRWYADNGVWDIGKATVGPDSAHSGQNVAGTMLTGNYPPNANTRLISPAITLPAVNNNEKLLFYVWQWFRMNEGNPWGSDLSAVQISDNDGKNWKDLNSAIGGYSWVWTQLCLDITKFSTLRIRIAFNFVSSDRAEDTGLYLDDIMIKKVPYPLYILRNPEDFESGISNWSASNGVWEIGKPRSGPPSAHSGQYCAGTILSGNYPPYADSRLESPEIKLIPKPNLIPELFFRHWYKMNENDPWGPDQGYVMISVNGKWKSQPIAGPYTGNSANWTQGFANLSAYIDSTIKIAFTLYSTDRVEDVGWYIDDIRIEGIVDPPISSSTYDKTLLAIEFSLRQNYPNPFNPSTTIEFSLPSSSHVVLKIYDVLGKDIMTMVDETLAAGQHQVHFDARHLASGVYFYKIQAGKFTQMKKMVLMQ